MMRSRRINLHTHTMFSDGTLTPEGVVDLLVSAGTRYASLTDHDTLAGLSRFHAALHQANIGFIPGVEITTYYGGQEFHVLGYGFDPTDQELNILLDTIRQLKPVETQGVAHNIRKSSNTSSAGYGGFVGLDHAIRVIHQAGGKAFLAHPLESCGDLAGVSLWLKKFSAFGLDGLEAWYGTYSESQQQGLAHLAKEHGLLTCGGTDLHNTTPQQLKLHAIEMPEEEWGRFRQAVMHGMDQSNPDNTNPADVSSQKARPPRRFRRRYFVLRIILPVLLTIALFSSALWGLILPAFEASLLDRKREMISELTNSAWSVLAAYERNEREGLLTREEAQEQAIAQIAAMRYGKEGKDYFWLQDMTPRIIMHPYRTDLVGQDVSNLQDPMGVKIFVEFSKLVRQKGEGYIKYVWQWKDDPARLEAKESFIKGFEPWGWIIGTGLYIEDVEAEIDRIETRVVNIALIITGSLVILLLFIAAQGIRVEKKRIEAEAGLRESIEKYQALVEAATEGVLLVLGHRCRYANPMLLALLGYNTRQLELLDLEDVLPRSDENQSAWALIQDSRKQNSFDAYLFNAAGGMIECAMTVSPIVSEGHPGQVFTIRPIGIDQDARKTEGEQLWRLGEVVQNATLVIFRARPSHRGAFSELNHYGKQLIHSLKGTDPSHPELEFFFRTPKEFAEYLEDLHASSEPVDYNGEMTLKDGGQFWFLVRAILQRDGNGEPAWIDGTIVDTSNLQIALLEKSVQCDQLEKQLDFLFRPLSNFKPRLVTIPVDTPAADAAKMMATQGSSAIIVNLPNGAPVGIVTDHDIRTRLVAERLPLDTPVQRIMSVPVQRVKENVRVYEALLEMENLGIGHMAVESYDGKIVSLIEAGQLLRFKDNGLNFAARMIKDARDLGEIIDVSKGLADHVQLRLVTEDDPVGISRLLTSIADAATEKLIDLSISQLGIPPSEFCFIAAGSQGRWEMTLGSDQDNAIIYCEPDSEAGRRAAEEYFRKLGQMVCEGLHHSGYPYCQGQIMANNPKWVLPVRSWETVFRDWILKAEPQELLDFSIFFDLRGVYGKLSLVDELIGAIHEMLNDQPIFFAHMGRNLIQQKPAIAEINRESGVNSANWNIKSYLLPMIGFARLYALQNNIRETNTINRLEKLSARGALHQNSLNAYVSSFSFLVEKRFASQISSEDHVKSPDFRIVTQRVSEDDILKIQHAHDQINLMLKRVSQDFLGGLQP